MYDEYVGVLWLHRLLCSVEYGAFSWHIPLVIQVCILIWSYGARRCHIPSRTIESSTGNGNQDMVVHTVQMCLLHVPCSCLGRCILTPCPSVIQGSHNRLLCMCQPGPWVVSGRCTRRQMLCFGCLGKGDLLNRGSGSCLVVHNVQHGLPHVGIGCVCYWCGFDIGIDLHCQCMSSLGYSCVYSNVG